MSLETEGRASKWAKETGLTDGRKRNILLGARSPWMTEALVLLTKVHQSLSYQDHGNVKVNLEGEVRKREAGHIP